MEADKANQQLQALKRNYEGVSKSAANDKAEFTKLMNERDQFKEEAETANARLEGIDKEIAEAKEETEKTRKEAQEYKRNLDVKIKEVERMKEEMKRREKQNQDKINQMNQASLKLGEETRKAKQDFKKASDTIV